MEDMVGAVAEAPEVSVESSDIGGSEQVETQSQQVEQPQQSENPFEPKSAREFSQWLKGLSNDPANAKFARVAKDAFSRMYALNQLEPRGVDGIRERYAMLDALSHGDLKGADALTAMQDTIQSVNEMDERIAQGDLSVLDSFDEQMKGGIMKMVPSLLDMQRQSDPEGYKAAVLPHFVEALRASPLVQSFNALVDTLNDGPPNWLPKENLAAWHQDRLNRVLQHAASMGEWLNAQDKQAKDLKNGQQTRQITPNNATQPQGEEQKWRQEQQKFHWESKIEPQVNQHAHNSFQQLFAAYDKRLKLEPAAKQALLNDFAKRVASKAAQNPVYRSQMQRFNKTTNPDPKQVVNLAKIEFDKHAKGVLEQLITERGYKSFLNGRPTLPNTQQNGQTRTNSAPIAPNVQIVSVKPRQDDINWRATTPEMIHAKKYQLNNGKIVQVRT